MKTLTEIKRTHDVCEHMPSQDGDVYVLRHSDGEVWARPTPVRTAIVDTVTERTPLEPDDIEDVEAYVDPGELRDVLTSEEGIVSFDVEGHEVFVDADGAIGVAG